MDCAQSTLDSSRRPYGLLWSIVNFCIDCISEIGPRLTSMTDWERELLELNISEPLSQNKSIQKFKYTFLSLSFVVHLVEKS